MKDFKEWQIEHYTQRCKDLPKNKFLKKTLKELSHEYNNNSFICMRHSSHSGLFSKRTAL